jgi:hypothetical protein
MGKWCGERWLDKNTGWIRRKPATRIAGLADRQRRDEAGGRRLWRRIRSEMKSRCDGKGMVAGLERATEVVVSEARRKGTVGTGRGAKMEEELGIEWYQKREERLAKRTG